MKFSKLHGAGNDFIIINNIEERIPEGQLAPLARALCSRRRSIGADGFMAVDTPQAGGDYRMIFYNADGTRGEMCGNGARCIARYGYEKGLGGTVQRIETVAGIVSVERNDRRSYTVRLNDPTCIRLTHQLAEGASPPSCAYVELGSPGLPHAVVPHPQGDELDDAQLHAFAQTLRHDSSLPKGANVNLYTRVSDDEVVVRTFERGVEGFTLACGTGAASVALVLTLTEQVTGDNVRIQMPGGTLCVTVRRSGQTIEGLYLTGPTSLVAEGTVLDEDLFDS